MKKLTKIFSISLMLLIVMTPLGNVFAAENTNDICPIVMYDEFVGMVKDASLEVQAMGVNLNKYGFYDFFESGKWITRDGVVSLSLRPKSFMYDETRFDSSNSALWAYMERAFETIEDKFSSDRRWKNTKSMRAQFYCHVLGPGLWKTPWNLEPHRTDTNWAIMIKNKCNP